MNEFKNVKKHTNNLSLIKKQKSNYEMGLDECLDLFEYLKHGDASHKIWLMQSIIAWACDGEKPDYIGRKF